jgi:hypothetical protein
MRKKAMKNLGAALAVFLAVAGIGFAVTSSVQRYTVSNAQVYELRSDGGEYLAGGLYFGNDDVLPTLPTKTTAQKFALKVPVYNVGATALTLGDLLISSATGTGYVQISTATNGLTSIVGVAAASIASGAKGWMIPLGGGFGVVKTTGTINIGDLLVSTSTANGRCGASASPATGSIVGRAMSSGTAAGDSVIAIMR